MPVGQSHQLAKHRSRPVVVKGVGETQAHDDSVDDAVTRPLNATCCVIVAAEHNSWERPEDEMWSAGAHVPRNKVRLFDQIHVVNVTYSTQ